MVVFFSSHTLSTGLVQHRAHLVNITGNPFIGTRNPLLQALVISLKPFDFVFELGYLLVQQRISIQVNPALRCLRCLGLLQILCTAFAFLAPSNLPNPPSKLLNLRLFARYELLLPALLILNLPDAHLLFLDRSLHFLDLRLDLVLPPTRLNEQLGCFLLNLGRKFPLCES